ncbi:MAG: hypothetical protein LBL66_03230, partial [Clostridiales bacterium]|nr:hypothetical protein [Clostridiales bacterium]
MNTGRGKPIEYLYKKSLYIFPAGSRIFADGDNLTVQISGKKADISQYAAGAGRRPAGLRIGLPVTWDGSQLAKEYKAVSDYLEKHRAFDFLHFEYATAHDLALCTFFRPADLRRIGGLIEDIGREMPYLLNVFKRPLIHLKETDIVQPVGAVRRVNCGTVRHLAAHAENVESVRGGAVMPARLLTRVYEDDYGIYENVVFRDLIDKVSAFLRKNILYLTEASDMFWERAGVDAVSRLRHPKYYLALGKLYLGFTQADPSAEIAALLERAKRQYWEIGRYKGRGVYAKNAKAKSVAGAVKK